MKKVWDIRRDSIEIVKYAYRYQKQTGIYITAVQACAMLNEQAATIEKYEAEAAERIRKAEADAKVAETMKKWGF